MFPFSNPYLSNWRAGSCLVVSMILVLGSALPVRGGAYLTDETSGVAEQLFGASVSELEDLNGDGRWEFLVGAPGDNVNGLEAGAAFYYRSRPDNEYGLQQVWRGVGGEQFGFAVARVGDVNSDGQPDFAVGAPLSNSVATDAGRVCLYWGGSTISATPDLVIPGEAAGDQFGFAISAAGDFNGDGEDDFIVGAPYRNAPGTDQGSAYIIFGGNGGPSSNLADALRLSGQVGGDLFGYSVSDAGNFLASAHDCVIVGAPRNDGAGIDAGAAYVYEGTTAPADPDAVFDLKITSNANFKANSRFGRAVRGIGRWDSDAYDDVAVGAPLCNDVASGAGRVEVVLGGPSPSSSGDLHVNGQTATDNFGSSLARVYDVIGSGNDDLLIGAPGYDGVAADGGRAYLYAGGSGSGGAGSLEILPNVPLQPGTQANDRFGSAVSAAGLLDDDADLDFVVAAPGGNIGTNATAGFVWINDSSGSLVGAYMAQWEAGWTAEGLVALEFAVSLPAEAMSALELVRTVQDQEGQVVQTETLWDGPVNLQGPADLGGGLSYDGSAFAFTDAAALPEEAYTGGVLYSLTLTDAAGQTVILGALAGPGQFPGELPATTLVLDKAWPNPFNPAVSVRFRAPGDRPAVCRVTDLRGRHVALLYTGPGLGQWRTVTWDGRDDTGSRAASGVYLINLEADGQRAVRRVVLAK